METINLKDQTKNWLIKWIEGYQTHQFQLRFTLAALLRTYLYISLQQEAKHLQQRPKSVWPIPWKSVAWLWMAWALAKARKTSQIALFVQMNLPKPSKMIQNHCKYHAEFSGIELVTENTRKSVNMIQHHCKYHAEFNGDDVLTDKHKEFCKNDPEPL